MDEELMEEFTEFCKVYTLENSIKPSWETFVAHKLSQMLADIAELQKTVLDLEIRTPKG